ncbi:unnamed protein product [Ectocarpus sp. 12 AP-2014]
MHPQRKDKMTGPDGEAELVVPAEVPGVPVVPSNPSEPDREDGLPPPPSYLSMVRPPPSYLSMVRTSQASSSSVGAVAPNLPARDFVRPSVVTGPPPPLPPTNTAAPVTVPVPTSTWWFNDLKKKYHECFPKGTYCSIDDDIETVDLVGNKGSRMLLLSVIVNAFLALIPVFTGDTGSSTCEEGVCVDGGDITYVYIIAAFIKYPWMIMLYLETGLWFTGSGLAVNSIILRDDLLSSVDDCSIPSLLDPFRCILRYVVVYEQILYWGVEFLVIVLGFLSFCNCAETSSDMSYLTYMAVIYVFIPPVRMFGFYLKWLENKEKRVKIFTWLDCLQDLLFNISIYTGVYGVSGLVFVLFPILGYLEAFSFLYS